MADAEINLLDYLRSKTQVDVDSLDVEVSAALGPFVDCTSNQMDAYNELIKPVHAGLLKKSAALAKEIHHDYPTVTYEELAYDISMVTLAQTIIPNITGAILVMANPLNSYSTPKIVENGQRLYRLCKYLQPGFDMSRLIVKVPSTWEGLQACRKLKGLGVQTLGTTLFTLEQGILAAEAGCIYVSPFLNELRAGIDPTYHDPNPIFDVTVNIQKYYEQHNCSTRVKACAAVNIEQIIKLAGIAAYTAPADQLQELASTKEPASQVTARSLFFGAKTDEHDAATANGTAAAANGTAATNGNAVSENGVNAHGHAEEKQGFKKLSFVDDESAFRRAFALSDDGRGQLKTSQALNIFSEYQIKGEALMRDTDLTNIG